MEENEKGPTHIMHWCVDTGKRERSLVSVGRKKEQPPKGCSNRKESENRCSMGRKCPFTYCPWVAALFSGPHLLSLSPSSLYLHTDTLCVHGPFHSLPFSRVYIFRYIPHTHRSQVTSKKLLAGHNVNHLTFLLLTLTTLAVVVKCVILISRLC